MWSGGSHEYLSRSHVSLRKYAKKVYFLLLTWPQFKATIFQCLCYVDVKLKMIENDVISPFQHLLSDLIEKCLEYIPPIIERAE